MKFIIIILLLSSVNLFSQKKVIVDSVKTCIDKTGGKILIFASRGSDPYEYSLDGETVQDSNYFENVKKGIYDVRVIDLFYEEAIYKYPIKITENHIKADFDIIINDIGEQKNLVFVNKSKNATNFEWDFGDKNNSNKKIPSHKYQKSNIYDIKLIASEKTGMCKDTVRRKYFVSTSPYFVYNMEFTPLKEILSFDVEQDFKDYSLSIFNNWGRKIYTITSKNNIWKGKLNNGLALNKGEYICFLKYKVDNKYKGLKTKLYVK